MRIKGLFFEIKNRVNTKVKERNFGLRLLILFLAGLLLQDLWGQEYQMRFSTITDKDGNKPSATFAVVEDHQGFIWFGTIDGLYRYDGFVFKIYRNEPNNPNSLSNNTIWGLDIDNNGIIWIATQGGGVDAFDPINENFTNYRYTGKNKNELTGNIVWSILVDKSNNVWAGISGSGVDRINTKTGKIDHFSLHKNGEDPEQDQSVLCLLEDDKGFIWSGFSQGGISVIDPEIGCIKRYYYAPGESKNIPNNMVYHLHQGSDNMIYAVTSGAGFLRLNPETDTFISVVGKNGAVPNVSLLCRSLAERVPNEFWIATEYGLSIFNTKLNTLKNYRQSDLVRNAISENRLREVYIDSKGIAWIGSESGVDKITTQHNFQNYTDFFNETSAPQSAIVKSLAVKDDYLWIGFINHGLVRYSEKNGKSKHYYNLINPLSSDEVSNVNALFFDSYGSFWVGDWNTGLLKYNRIKDRFENIANADFNTERLGDNRIQRIIEGRPGVLWIGTEGGLHRYDVKNDRFIRFKHEKNNPNSLSSNTIQSRAIVFDKDSNLWLGTWAFGLNKMEFTDKERTSANFKHFIHEPGNQNSLPNNNVISLLYDTTNLWIGTFGGGLSKFNLESNKFINYTVENGLPNNVIFAIFKDKNGNLWLSTDNGVSMFNPVKETFYNYNKEDGLQDNHFFWGAAFQNPDGAIYYGGIKGVNRFIPEKVMPDTSPTRPVITDIKLFDKSIDKERYNLLSSEVHFHYFENFISFEFAALNYFEPENNIYKHKLVGFDKNWIFSKKMNYATYSNLPPGEYTFMLQVANSDGVWNDEILSLKVLIIPPWWKTIMARILFVLFGGSIFFLIIRVRINLLKKQKKKLESLVAKRTEEVKIKNDELREKYEEIVAQDEENREQAEELKTLSDKLKGVNRDLARKVKERTFELENALGRAEDSQKLISSFLSNFSHEIRTPLNAIMGFSQLIGDEELTNKKRGNYADIIEQNVLSLLMQIDNIMDVAKLHTGQYVVKNNLFSLGELLQSVFDELKNKNKIRNSKVSLVLNVENEVILNSDKEAFKALIYNLVENAIKYTESGSVEFGYFVEPKLNENNFQFEISQKFTLSIKDFCE
jgi:ligand-binding sensor domain-containing protein/signal transduction histidine kinase